jgi:hypothetical protein
MAEASRRPLADERAALGAWGRSDAVLFVLALVALVLTVAQFAVAGFGAFTMDKTPTDKAYGAHVVLGLVIGVLALLIVAAVLASPPGRAHRRTLWLAVALAVLSVVLQPVLGEGGTRVPVVGALHALNGLAIFAVIGWLTWETARRREARVSEG